MTRDQSSLPPPLPPDHRLVVKYADLIGKTRNRLTIKYFAYKSDGHKTLMAVCLCECGNWTVTSLCAIRRSNTKSCGCLWLEKLRTNRRTHGMTRSREFNIWNGMLQRCNNDRNPGYRYYGGRGVTVCRRWQKFENFIADMGLCPPKLTLERRDNSGPYSPANCYWATRVEQQRNRRNTLRFTFNGKTKTLMEWSIAVGIRYKTLLYRHSVGWSVARMLTQPLQGKR